MKKNEKLSIKSNDAKNVVIFQFQRNILTHQHFHPVLLKNMGYTTSFYIVTQGILTTGGNKKGKTKYLYNVTGIKTVSCGHILRAIAIFNGLI